MWLSWGRWFVRVAVLATCIVAARVLLSPDGGRGQVPSRSPPDVVRGKGTLSFSTDLIQVVVDQSELVPGHRYWLVQRAEAAGRCVVGLFVLRTFGEYRIEFEAPARSSARSRLEEYAAAHGFRLSFEVHSSASLVVHPAHACALWMATRIEPHSEKGRGNEAK